MDKSFEFKDRMFRRRTCLESYYSIASKFNFGSRIVEISDEGPIVEFSVTDENGEVVAQPVIKLLWDQEGELMLNSNMDDDNYLSLIAVAIK